MDVLDTQVKALEEEKRRLIAHQDKISSHNARVSKKIKEIHAQNNDRVLEVTASQRRCEQLQNYLVFIAKRLADPA